MNGCLPFKLIFRLLEKVKIDHVQSRTLRISGHSNITLIDHALVLENSAGFHVGWSAVLCVCISCSVVSDSLRPHVLVCQAPLSMEFSRREYWSGLPFPFPGDLPDPDIKPRSLALQADSLPSEPLGKPIDCAAYSQFPFLLCPW